jgi:hypothetical protein
MEHCSFSEPEGGNVPTNNCHEQSMLQNSEDSIMDDNELNQSIDVLGKLSYVLYIENESYHLDVISKLFLKNKNTHSKGCSSIVTFQ